MARVILNVQVVGLPELVPVSIYIDDPLIIRRDFKSQMSE